LKNGINRKGTNMNLKRIMGPRVLVRLPEKAGPTETEDGVFIPESAAQDLIAYEQGEIIMLGDGLDGLEVGQKVLVPRMANKFPVTKDEEAGHGDWLMIDGEISGIIE
jgi:co-chaperonin GroES (HSP10)